MTLQELLPPGIYPIWSPCDSFEAADALTKALAEEEQTPGIEMSVLKASLPIQGTEEQIRNDGNLIFRPLNDQP